MEEDEKIEIVFLLQKGHLPVEKKLGCHSNIHNNFEVIFNLKKK
jgi:hypothetical protein